MRKTLSSVLIGLGAFLLVTAALVRFYAYPELAKSPTNLTSDTKLSAQGATVFDIATLKPITTDLTVSSHTVADSSAKTPDGTVVWTNSTVVTLPDGTVFQQSMERSPFDSVSGAGVDCESCGQFTEVADPVTGAVQRVDTVRSGLIYKFPFNTQKHDYQAWDSTLGKATTAKYVGQGKVDGLTYYKFEQDIPVTQVGTQDLPGSVFGASAASVTADSMYAMKRTFWVEPVTGAPVNRIEDRNQFFEYHGKQVGAFTGTVAYTDGQVKELVDDAKSQAPYLAGMRLLFPLVGLVLGLLAIAGGLVLRRGRGTPDAPAELDDRTMISA